jgi:hypothetical protein
MGSLAGKGGFFFYLAFNIGNWQGYPLSMSHDTIGWIQSSIFVVQTLVFGYQALKLKETVAGGIESTNQAIRAANAMEVSAKAATTSAQNVTTLTERTNQQLRAYLSVQFGGGIYQDANHIFEVRPLLVNVGQTPALRVRYAAKADILPFPLPTDFVFPPLHEPGASYGVLAPHQNFTMNAYIDRRLPDEEAEAIKRSLGGKRLYMWGTIFYDDVFEKPHHYNFAQSIYWIAGEKGELPLGNYADRHNEAT